MRTLKTIGVLGTTIALLLSTGVVSAQEQSTGVEQSAETSVPMRTPQAIKEDARKAVQEDARKAQALVQSARDEANARVQNLQKEAQSRAKAAIASTSALMQSTREEVKARIEAIREEAKATVEAKREEAKTRVEAVREEAKARIEAQREKVKQRLADIRDEKKQKTAEKIATQFNNLNVKWTDHFMQVLDHYDAIVQKMQVRADIASTNGKDVVEATAAIQAAKSVIASARDSVTVQAAKTYTLNASAITTTASTTTAGGQEELVQELRASFQSIHSMLFNDLFALRDGMMKTVREAVQKALQTLSSIPGVDEEQATEATTSNQ